MIFTSQALTAIRDGVVSLAFRRWTRPTVRSGGTLLTAAGQLQIREVARVERSSITADAARRAGYASVAALLADLDARAEGEIYRIVLGELVPDPRVALREDSTLDDATIQQLTKKLARLDAGADGAWTRRVLALLRDRPAVRAASLCGEVGQERDRFKLNVRKLKQLGLTESLEVGYRLSPRGARLLAALTETRREDW